MIAGMVPMALGLGEGGEQTAPLGRAVIGGLVAATLATLVVLPAVFAVVQAGAGRQSASLDPDDPREPLLRPGPWRRRTVAAAASPGQRRSGRSIRPRKPPVSRGLMGLVALAALGAAALRLRAAVAGPVEPGPGRRTRRAAAATRVEVVRPERRTIRRTTQQPGQIEAYETTPIHAKVAGYVREWNVDIGAKVKKGQVLAVLDVPELEAEAEQKQAAVEEAQAKLAQARAAVEVAQAASSASRPG